MRKAIQRPKYYLVFIVFFSLGMENRSLCNGNKQTERSFDSRWGELCPNECVLNKLQQATTSKLYTKVCDLHGSLDMTWALYKEKLRYSKYQKFTMERDTQLLNDDLLKINRTTQRSASQINDTQRVLNKNQQIMKPISSEDKKNNAELQRILNNITHYTSRECEPKTQVQMSCKLPINIARDCADLFLQGAKKSGVYFIIPDSTTTPMRAYCDMEDAGGGWTVIQRRFDGCLNFMRSWNDYKDGFGQWSCDDVGELWMGNENIYKLTQQDKQQLKVDLVSYRDEERYAWFSYFRIGNETEKYKLRFIEGYRRDPNKDIGNAFRGITTRNNDDQKKMEFSINCDTNDCAKDTGGWWFNKCNLANLNANWYHGKLKLKLLRKGLSGNGILWKTWENKYFKKTTMKIRPLGFNSNAWKRASNK